MTAMAFQHGAALGGNVKTPFLKNPVLFSIVFRDVGSPRGSTVNSSGVVLLTHVLPDLRHQDLFDLRV